MVSPTIGYMIYQNLTCMQYMIYQCMADFPAIYELPTFLAGTSSFSALKASLQYMNYQHVEAVIDRPLHINTYFFNAHPQETTNQIYTYGAISRLLGEKLKQRIYIALKRNRLSVSIPYR